MIRPEQGGPSLFYVDERGQMFRTTCACAARANRALAKQLARAEADEWTVHYGFGGQQRLKWIVAQAFHAAPRCQEPHQLIVLASVPFAWSEADAGAGNRCRAMVGLLSAAARRWGGHRDSPSTTPSTARVRAGTLRSREDIIAARAEGTVRDSGRRS
jgi:hypothetical protein